MSDPKLTFKVGDRVRVVTDRVYGVETHTDRVGTIDSIEVGCDGTDIWVLLDGEGNCVPFRFDSSSRTGEQLERIEK